MELWDRITGTVTLRLTAADPEGLLDHLTRRGIDLYEVERKDGLELTFRIRAGDLKTVREQAARRGGEVKVLGLAGGYSRIRGWLRRPLVLLTLLFLLAATWVVPSRILFIRVVGNDTVPTRLILETAAGQGLGFGVERAAVRSEALKNQLLGAIDELEWVGVNTSGCVATITVREREPEGQEQAEGMGDIVSAADGIVDSVTLIRGTLLCAPGQAVREGQVLVSGVEDLGIATRIVGAEAEIYAFTSRNVTAVLPENTLARGAQGRSTRKISLQIGKKRINLHSGSGILPMTCGKMTTVKSLTMPGGWELPVKLVIEEYTSWDTGLISRENPEALLAQAARRALTESGVACTVLTARQELTQTGERFELQCRCECREMIARLRDAADVEGDTKDDH